MVIGHDGCDRLAVGSLATDGLRTLDAQDAQRQGGKHREREE
jgi:hypothetical protein